MFSDCQNSTTKKKRIMCGCGHFSTIKLCNAMMLGKSKPLKKIGFVYDNYAQNDQSVTEGGCSYPRILKYK